LIFPTRRGFGDGLLEGRPRAIPAHAIGYGSAESGYTHGEKQKPDNYRHFHDRLLVWVSNAPDCQRFAWLLEGSQFAQVYIQQRLSRRDVGRFQNEEIDMKTLSIPIAALVFAAVPLAAVAQDRTIDGRAVPQDQAGAIEDRCAELLTLQGDTGTQTPETALAETTEKAAASGSEGNIDVSAITLEQCREGGFLPE
jgi:hypothetical protein